MKKIVFLLTMLFFFTGSVQAQAPKIDNEFNNIEEVKDYNSQFTY